MRYFVDSYGCAMNKGEGRQLSARLAGMGHEPAREASEADLVVLNTCTVLGGTESRMLRRLADLESEGKSVLVAGCMAKAQPRLIRRHSRDALILAPERYGSLHEVLGEPPSPPARLPAGLSEALPLAQGCLGSCSYCITRLARGTLRSRDPEEVLEEFDHLLSAGAREIHLCAQDAACYGLDIGSGLPELLASMLERPGDHRLRIGMMSPDRASPILDDLLPLMRDPRVYRFLHLPLQSGSDSVLESMGRRYRAEDLLGLVARAREALPDLSLATDIINGFPGESDEDHLLSMEAMRSLRAETVNISRFSPRPGTPAFSLPGRPSGDLARERSREATRLRFLLSSERNAEQVGKVESCLVTERGRGGTSIARTGAYRPVVLKGRPPLGSHLRLRICGHARTHLLGEPADAPALNN